MFLKENIYDIGKDKVYKWNTDLYMGWGKPWAWHKSTIPLYAFTLWPYDVAVFGNDGAFADIGSVYKNIEN